MTRTMKFVSQFCGKMFPSPGFSYNRWDHLPTTSLKFGENFMTVRRIVCVVVVASAWFIVPLRAGEPGRIDSAEVRETSQHDQTRNLANLAGWRLIGIRAFGKRDRKLPRKASRSFSWLEAAAHLPRDAERLVVA